MRGCLCGTKVPPVGPKSGFRLDSEDFNFETQTFENVSESVDFVDVGLINHKFTKVSAAASFQLHIQASRQAQPLLNLEKAPRESICLSIYKG
jgi:hypothetical protein